VANPIPSPGSVPAPSSSTNTKVFGEIDIDSDEIAAFDELDQELLEKIAAMLAERL